MVGPLPTSESLRPGSGARLHWFALAASLALKRLHASMLAGEALSGVRPAAFTVSMKTEPGFSMRPGKCGCW